MSSQARRVSDTLPLFRDFQVSRQTPHARCGQPRRHQQGPALRRLALAHEQPILCSTHCHCRFRGPQRSGKRRENADRRRLRELSVVGQGDTTPMERPSASTMLVTASSFGAGAVRSIRRWCRPNAGLSLRLAATGGALVGRSARGGQVVRGVD